MSGSGPPSPAGGSLAFYAALRTGIAIAGVLPPSVVIRGAGALFSLGGRFSPARAIVAGNLRRIEACRRTAGDAAARSPGPDAVFRSYGRYWGEFLALAAHPGHFDRITIRPEGREHLDAAAARGPVCVLTGHFGNWDLGARWLARTLPGLAVAAEELRPPGLFSLFRRIREEAGARVIPSPRGGAGLYRHLRSGGHAALVADRVFGAGRVSVPFLGGERTFSSGGILLARRAGASLVPAFLRREADGFVVRFHPDVSAMDDPVTGFARALEAEVLARPEQWCVFESVHHGHPDHESPLNPPHLE